MSPAIIQIRARFLGPGYRQSTVIGQQDGLDLDPRQPPVMAIRTQSQKRLHTLGRFFVVQQPLIGLHQAEGGPLVVRLQLQRLQISITDRGSLKLVVRSGNGGPGGGVRLVPRNGIHQVLSAGFRVVSPLRIEQLLAASDRPRVVADPLKFPGLFVPGVLAQQDAKLLQRQIDPSRALVEQRQKEHGLRIRAIQLDSGLEVPLGLFQIVEPLIHVAQHEFQPGDQGGRLVGAPGHSDRILVTVGFQVDFRQRDASRNERRVVDQTSTQPRLSLFQPMGG